MVIGRSDRGRTLAPGDARATRPRGAGSRAVAPRDRPRYPARRRHPAPNVEDGSLAGWPRRLIAALFLLPLWLMAVSSLRPVGQAPPTSVQWFPASPAWGNYAEVFDVVPLARYTANSLVVAAVAVPLSVLVSSWAGFAIARLPRRAARGPRRAVRRGADGAPDLVARRTGERLPMARPHGHADPVDGAGAHGHVPAVRLALRLDDVAVAARPVRPRVGTRPLAALDVVAGGDAPAARDHRGRRRARLRAVVGELPRPVDLHLRRAVVHAAARHAVAGDPAGARPAADAGRRRRSPAHPCFSRSRSRSDDRSPTRPWRSLHDTVPFGSSSPRPSRPCSLRARRREATSRHPFRRRPPRSRSGCRATRRRRRRSSTWPTDSRRRRTRSTSIWCRSRNATT